MDFSFLLLALGQIISPQTIAYALAALGLAVQFGFTGLLNFGQAGFMAIGGYAFAITTLRLGFPFWLAVLSTIVATTVMALILGIPTLRLRADYLAIVTIAAAEIVRYVVKTPDLIPLTGGCGTTRTTCGSSSSAGSSSCSSRCSCGSSCAAPGAA
jgi:ABC-type branched-subunit amino acid transport system permease subunit